MADPKLVAALAGVFGALTALLALLGLLVSPVALAVAVPFGATAYFLWYHASGRLADRVAAEHRQRRRARGRERRSERTDRRRAPDATPGPTDAEAEAYRVLGLDPDADDAAVRRAYRQRVKEVHPDRGGDEAAFRRVRDAYERLRDDE